jgi:ribosomal protein L40E
MMDDLRTPRWWIWVAAVLAILLLFYETGSWVLTAILFLGFGAFVIYQTRSHQKPNAPAMYCLRCNAKLNPNARECRACGSASWSYKN